MTKKKLTRKQKVEIIQHRYNVVHDINIIKNHKYFRALPVTLQLSLCKRNFFLHKTEKNYELRNFLTKNRIGFIDIWRIENGYYIDYWFTKKKIIEETRFKVLSSS